MGHEDVPIAFFSYCREDSDFALKLAADLKVAGAHVWIDQLDIEPGTPWDRAVEEALTHSPRMLVVLSPVSVNSDNVRDEVSFALSRQKRVIPVLYRDCEVPFRLARLQHIDFRPNYERALAILVRALGVGQAAHPQMSSSVAAAAAAVESAVSGVETEERAREQKLDEERRLAEDQAHLEQARKYAAEQARLKKERESAAAEQALREQAAREQEQQRTEAEDRARQEQPRREQRAAEQARLEQEARLASERVRLAQEEKERREAEIKARQEQLRREEEESVERKGLVLDGEPQLAQPTAEPRAEVEPAPAAARGGFEQLPTSAPSARASAPLQPQATRPNFTSPKYLAVGAILVFVLGFIVFRVAYRSPQEKSSESKLAQSKAAETAALQQSQPTPADKISSESTSPATQPAVSPADTTEQEQPKEKANPAAAYTKELPKSNPAGTYSKEIPKSKNPPPQNMADTSFLNGVGSAPGAPLNTANAASTASSSNRVRITQNVSHGMLMQEIAPKYPPLARSAHVQGPVTLNVIIGKDGSIKEIKAESGHPLLIPAAIEAVKQWRYKAYKIDGKPVEVTTQVVVNFRLTN